jgi:hypothetical protein
LARRSANGAGSSSCSRAAPGAAQSAQSAASPIAAGPLERSSVVAAGEYFTLDVALHGMGARDAPHAGGALSFAAREQI